MAITQLAQTTLRSRYRAYGVDKQFEERDESIGTAVLPRWLPELGAKAFCVMRLKTGSAARNPPNAGANYRRTRKRACIAESGRKSNKSTFASGQCEAESNNPARGSGLRSMRQMPKIARINCASCEAELAPCCRSQCRSICQIAAALQTKAARMRSIWRQEQYVAACNTKA